MPQAAIRYGLRFSRAWGFVYGEGQGGTGQTVYMQIRMVLSGANPDRAQGEGDPSHCRQMVCGWVTGRNPPCRGLEAGSSGGEKGVQRP